jgi:xanthosine utilization system XapX-like protein
MLLQMLGAGLVLALVFTLFLRPGAILAILLAVGVVVAAVVVSWNDVEQVHAERAARAAFQQETANASPNVTVPPPTPTHSGT